jgi:hypothetical protein
MSAESELLIPRLTHNATRPREFFKNFYHIDAFLGTRISEEASGLEHRSQAALLPPVSLACRRGLQTSAALGGHRCPHLDGDADRIVPISASGQRIAKLIKETRLASIKDLPPLLFSDAAGRGPSFLSGKRH